MHDQTQFSFEENKNILRSRTLELINNARIEF
jgi:hypothetical protein